jgi:hypothetical protein
MRILIIVLFVLIGAAALTELNPGSEQTSNPIMKGLGVVRGWFDNSSHLIKALPSTEKPHETTVYKWQDKNGGWHFSNAVPADDINSSVQTYRSDINITQPTQLPKPAAAQPKTATPNTKAAASPPQKNRSPLLPITDPKRVQQLIDDAKNVQNLVNERVNNIDDHLPP